MKVLLSKTARLTGAAAVGAALAFSGQAFAENVITLGSAISITGKYSQEGKNASDGYNFAVKRINEMGGVKINGKTYKFGSSTTTTSRRRRVRRS